MELMGHHADSVADDVSVSFIDRIKHWARYEAPWFLASLTGHVVVLLILALVAKNVVLKNQTGEAPAIEETDTPIDEPPPPPPEKFDLGEAPLDPTTLDDAAMVEAPFQEAQSADYIDDSAGYEARGGGMASGSADNFGVGGFDIKGVGQGGFFKGTGGVGIGKGDGVNGGSGGSGTGIGGRGYGHREALAASGGTRRSERAVAAALNWIARHQMPDGSWSLDDYTKKCADATCTGHGEKDADAAATALALLPFLAAGQTHQSRGTYSQNVQRGLYWLISHQKPDGDCTAGAKGQKMYSHGLCAIALCEAAAMVPTDQAVKGAAQKAINYILAAQNPGTGGWRYQPGDPGDTSVVGWQVMALKSAEMAYLNVSPKGFDGAKKWLDSCAHGNYKELFSYTPESAATPTMSAVGMLCSQYMKTMKPGDPKMQAGLDYLMKHSPDAVKGNRNIYYLYYATQVVHNVPGPQWEDWNRQMRRILIETQEKEGCATGSWSPDKPTKDQWGTAGGRLMVTSLSCLTLEIYYRYLPLFKMDNEKDLNKLPGLNEKGEEQDKKPAAKK